MDKDALSLGTINWDFTTFLRYFVPGVFTAFWVIVYFIRMTDGMGSEEIGSVRDLARYLFTNWPGMIGLMAMLGSFLGLLLVGIDPIVRAFMGSRLMNFAFKYLLSSKKVDFAYFQFLRLHDLSHRYDRLPRSLVESSFYKESFRVLYDGDYSSRYLFRETIQNYFWDRCLEANVRTGLRRRFEQASTYLYLSFISLLLLGIQSCFYAVHLLSSTSKLLSLSFWFGEYFYIPMILLAYVLATFAYNLYYYEIVRWSKFKEISAGLIGTERVVLMIVSGLVVVALTYIVFSKLQELSWIPSLDTILWVIFFVMFVSFYWSSSFQFSRYAVTFEHCFEECRDNLLEFATKNLNLIRSMNSDLSRKKKEVKKRRDLLLKSLPFLFLVLGLVVVSLAYLAITTPIKNETVVTNYSKTVNRMLNLTSGDSIFVWLRITPLDLGGVDSIGNTIKLRVVNPSNITALNNEEILATNSLSPVFFVADQTGSYVVQFNNSVGNPIDKTIWFSYRIGQSILGIPVEYWLFYVLVIDVILTSIVIVAIWVRRRSIVTSSGKH